MFIYELAEMHFFDIERRRRRRGYFGEKAATCAVNRRVESIDGVDTLLLLGNRLLSSTSASTRKYFIFHQFFFFFFFKYVHLK